MLSHRACGSLVPRLAVANRCASWNQVLAARFAASAPSSAAQFAPHSGKALFLGVGLTGVTAVLGTYAYDYLFAKKHGDLEATLRGAFDEWDDKWDYKEGDPPPEVIPMLNTLGKYRANEQEMDFGVRRLVLVRHAQSEGKALTAQGREQATKTGKHLQTLLGKTARVVYTSRSAEASETAKLLQPHLGNCEVAQLSQLDEGIPTIPSPRPAAFNKEHEKAIGLDGPRLEGAFSCLFVRPTGAQLDRSAVEVVVSSGNILRYFVCRALQLPDTAWLRFKCEHCGIVMMDINVAGEVTLSEFGSVGHIPSNLRSS